MVETQSFRRLILRVVLRQVSPMVIRLVSVFDQMQLSDFPRCLPHHFGLAGRSGLPPSRPWSGVQQLPPENPVQSLSRIEVHRQEKFLYTCDTLHNWEWDVRVVDREAGVT